MMRSISLPAVLVAALLPVTAAAEDDGHGHGAGATDGRPALSLVLDGFFYHDNQQGEGDEILEEAAGILHGVHADEHGHARENGFNLGESELAVEASLPSQLKARLSLALLADEIELEEAWLETQGLPAGLAVKAGRFLSGIGYLNSQHKHEQDFAGDNLVYGALLGGHGLLDTGMQLTWQAPVPFYLLFGVEALQGQDQERFGTLVEPEEADAVVLSGAGLPEHQAGPRTGTFFIKLAPYLGEQHSLQFGLSLAHASQFQQLIDEDDTVVDDQFALDGQQSLAGMDVVYELDGRGEQGKGDLELVAEYLLLEKDMRVTGADAAAPVLVGDTVSGTQDGMYVQASYGIAPRWQLGLRHEVSGMQNELDEAGSVLAFDASSRTTLAVTFRPNPSTRLRMQFSSADVSDEAGATTQLNEFVLGYTGTFGGHEGHAH